MRAGKMPDIGQWRQYIPAPERLKLFALAATLLVPLGLLHAFLLAEFGIGITDILFLLAAFRQRNWQPFRQTWFVAAIIWWLWLLVCSVPIGHVTAGWSNAVVQAAVIIRFLVFALALQTWVLTTQTGRRTLWALLALSCLWIGVEAWQQYLTGRNIFGDHRWGDGALTGPFWKPRAGILYSHLLFVVVPPLAMKLRGRAGSVLAGVLLSLGAVTAVLIGQRMGTAFMILGALATAAFLPRLRRPVAAALLAAGLTLLATPIISPPTHAKLVGETSKNLTHFSRSPYGEIYTRAAVMGLDSPWRGWGYNGFRTFCPAPQFDAGLPALGIAPTSTAMFACNLHPHNFYLQAFEESGFPGLALFTLMNLLWLVALRPKPARDPVLVGLFIGVLTYAWPIASTDAFPTLYEPGWLFVILGLGLAHARAMSTSNAPYCDAI